MFKFYWHFWGLVFIALLQILYMPAVHADRLIALQYHHVDEDTPSITSISPKTFLQQLDLIEDSGFSFLSWQEFQQVALDPHLLNGKPRVLLTFDDANRSVCEVVWPILKKRKIPFLLFVVPGVVTSSTVVNDVEGYDNGDGHYGDNRYSAYCSWQQLQEMAKSDLVAIANHSMQHDYFLRKFHPSEYESNNNTDVKNTALHYFENDVLVTQQALVEKGLRPVMAYAYPYGEYNSNLQKILLQHGYIGFGQHSGPVDIRKLNNAVPRYPMSGIYGSMEQLQEKLQTYPMPLLDSVFPENPLNKSDNPPRLSLQFSEKIPLRCFNGRGESLPVLWSNDRQHSGVTSNKIIAEVQEKVGLPQGRSRYNCTAPRPQGGYYWFSQPWLVLE